MAVPTLSFNPSTLVGSDAAGCTTGTACAGLPEWALLCRVGRNSRRRNATTARSHTSDGFAVEVSFWLVDPPGVYYFSVSCPGYQNFTSSLICTEDAFVLFSVACWGSTENYFIYTARGRNNSRDSRIHAAGDPPLHCVPHRDALLPPSCVGLRSMVVPSTQLVGSDAAGCTTGTARSRFPEWALLCRVGRKSRRRNATTARSHTRDGFAVEVSFWLVDPPGVSYFSVRCPGYQKFTSSLICAEDAFVLFSVAPWGSTQHYIVYTARGRGPGPTTIFGLLPRGGEHYAVAFIDRKVRNWTLDGDSWRFDTYIFSSKTGAWRSSHASLVHLSVSDKRLCDQHTFSKQITVGEGSMGWVDSDHGILLLHNLFDDGRPVIDLIPLPRCASRYKFFDVDILNLEKATLTHQIEDKVPMIAHDNKLELCELRVSFLVTNDVLERMHSHVTDKQHICYGLVIGISLLNTRLRENRRRVQDRPFDSNHGICPKIHDPTLKQRFTRERHVASTVEKAANIINEFVGLRHHFGGCFFFDSCIVYDITRREMFRNLSDIWTKEIDQYSTNQDCIKMKESLAVGLGPILGLHMNGWGLSKTGPELNSLATKTAGRLLLLRPLPRLPKVHFLAHLRQDAFVLFSVAPWGSTQHYFVYTARGRGPGPGPTVTQPSLRLLPHPSPAFNGWHTIFGLLPRGGEHYAVAFVDRKVHNWTLDGDFWRFDTYLFSSETGAWRSNHASLVHLSVSDKRLCDQHTFSKQITVGEGSMGWVDSDHGILLLHNLFDDGRPIIDLIPLPRCASRYFFNEKNLKIFLDLNKIWRICYTEWGSHKSQWAIPATLTVERVALQQHRLTVQNVTVSVMNKRINLYTPDRRIVTC
uniref:DUF1618 domain-containing protein n=1 Tax=Triticum aestivum TaxID=4565 RepID=A0A077RVK8_WHEAT|nr:unnamed protein product [Triticum aestivum]